MRTVSTHFKRSLLLALSTLLLGFGCTLKSTAQESIYPTVFYAGINPISIRDGDGIVNVEMKRDGDWVPVVIGLKTKYWSVIGAPVTIACPKKVLLTMIVERIDVSISLNFRVTDCKGSKETYSLSLENIWNLFHEDFGTITLNDKPCHTFMVESRGGDFTVEKITSPAKRFKVSFPFKRPPLRIRGNRTYRYSVCFEPNKLGRVKVPIFVHVRRDQPVGDYRTYIVADTAYANVVRPTNAPIEVPITNRPVESAPKPKPPKWSISEPIVPPDPPVQATMVELLGGDPLIEESDVTYDVTSIESREGREPTEITYVNDPTIFRVVVTPSAFQPKSNSWFIGTYDVVGVVAGYGINDHLSLIGGGTILPTSNGTVGLLTLGAKQSLFNSGEFRLAGGIQNNYSWSSESGILTIAPYAVATIGPPDYNANLSASYAWRKHFPNDTATLSFEKRSVVAGLGGNVRLSNSWKISGEIYALPDTDLYPLAITGRWFNNKLAVEGGAVLNIGDSDALPLLSPLFSLLYVW